LTRACVTVQCSRHVVIHQ